MRSLRFIVVLSVLIGLISCEKQPFPEQRTYSDTDGISFFAEAQIPDGWDPLTKAVNVDDTYLQTNGFGVYAYYTGTVNYSGPGDVKGILLNNRKVTYARDYKYNAGTWTQPTQDKAWIYYGPNYYDSAVDGSRDGYKEYWPMKDGEKVTFFAYAPYNLWKSDVSAADGAVPSIPYQLYKQGNTGVSMNGSNPTVTVQSATFGDGIQRDLLWGVQSTGSPYKNFTRPATTTNESEKNTVHFRFRHALSKIGFNILTEEVPTVSESALTSNPWSDNRAVTSQNYSQYFNSYPHNTVYLLEYVNISSSDGLLANSATLSLDNTSAADQPEWSGKSGSITYNFTNANTITFSNDILWYRNNTNNSSYSNNTSKYSTLLGRRAQVTGLNATPASLMGGAGNYFYALPGSGQITVTVKIHKLTFYYHYGNNNSSRYWTVYDGEDDIDPIVKTFPVNLEAGRRYDFNLILSGKEMELELEVKPWELESFSYEYTDENYRVVEHLTFDSDYIDYRIDDKVYINNRVGKFTFCVDGGRYLYWRASLIPNSAFGFTDEYGNYLKDTSGELLTMLSGRLGLDVHNEVYIKALNTSSTTMNSARLRFYFYDGEGNAVVPMNLINLKTSGANPQQILEWTVVQNAN